MGCKEFQSLYGIRRNTTRPDKCVGAFLSESESESESESRLCYIKTYKPTLLQWNLQNKMKNTSENSDVQ